MNNKKTNKGKGGVVAFIKHNAYYLIMAFCLIAIITMVTVAVVGANNNKKGNNKVEPSSPVVDDKPVVEEVDMNFILPVAGATLAKGYSVNNQLDYNEITKEYSFHSGVDFVTADKTAVVAVLDGEVVAIKNHKMYGTVVEIKHAKDITTVYRSLDNDVKVKVGDKVKKGAIIGYTSKSDISESNLGHHVHLEILETGVNVNPTKYLTLEEK